MRMVIESVLLENGIPDAQNLPCLIDLHYCLYWCLCDTVIGNLSAILNTAESVYILT